ncbi:Hypp8122 [Branchiostoma lanceolatum]|uniref:Hypp8122 protein n=1 Tax=Branchiostoma lanceolatum TaxID=7740 RepID=A0A8K0ECY7_BRALA|nr:Hypp8122 [Branchiostoma lanceolatum]
MEFNNCVEPYRCVSAMCPQKTAPTDPDTSDWHNSQYRVPSPEEICRQLEEAMEDFHFEMKLGGFSERWLGDLANLWFKNEDLDKADLGGSYPLPRKNSSLPYNCYRCDKVLRDYLSLAKHVLVYHEEDCPKVLEGSMCEVCGKVCRSAAGLASHRRQRHTDTGAELELEHGGGTI